jgi:hypothetical protein
MRKSIFVFLTLTFNCSINSFSQELLDSEFSFSTTSISSVVWVIENGKASELSRDTKIVLCSIQVFKDKIIVTNPDEIIEYSIVSKKYSDVIQGYTYSTQNERVQFLKNWYFSVKPKDWFSAERYTELIYQPIVSIEIK